MCCDISKIQLWNTVIGITNINTIQSKKGGKLKENIDIPTPLEVFEDLPSLLSYYFGGTGISRTVTTYQYE